jgi:hypothetical protein
MKGQTVTDLLTAISLFFLVLDKLRVIFHKFFYNFGKVFFSMVEAEFRFL